MKKFVNRTSNKLFIHMQKHPEKFFSFVLNGTKAIRLDRFLSEELRSEGVSREKIKTAIRNGSCMVEKEICLDVDRKVLPGENISLCLQASPSQVMPEQGDLDILYEDEHLLIVNKAPGLVVHPAPSCPEGTLVHRLLSRFPQLEIQGGFRPGIVHRIDKDTSGLLCIALTEEARLRMAEAFAARRVHKEYLALVFGVPGGDSGTNLYGVINLPIGRHPTKKTQMAVVDRGKPACTEWQIKHVGSRSRYSLLSVKIHTGRTHQIRVHMAHMGHPLLGDRVYGMRGWTEDCAPRQMLHAWKLEFEHPVTGKALRFSCPPPEDFFQTILSLEKHMQKVVVTSVAGCGKSAFMQFLSEQGIPVWSADAAVIQLYEPGQAGWKILLERFGERFIPARDKAVDRKALALALLPCTAKNDSNDNEFSENRVIDKEEIEALIHPLVFHELERFWLRCEEQGQELAVAEVPLWFESLKNGTKPEEDIFLLGIACDEAERRRRLLHVRGWSPDFMAYMDGQQWNQARKMASCDKVIHNEGTLDDLKEQCRLFLEDMASRQKKKEIFFQSLLQG